MNNTKIFGIKSLLIIAFVLSMQILNAQTNNNLKKFAQMYAYGTATALDVSPNGKFIVSGNTDGRVYLWDAQNGYYIRSFIVHQAKVNEVKFVANDVILCSSADKTMAFCDANTGKIDYIRKTSSGELLSEVTAFDVYGNELITGHKNFIIRRWFIHGKNLKNNGLPLTGHTWEISDINFAHLGGAFVSSGAGGTVIKWNAQGYSEEKFEEHYNSATTADISPDGSMVASGGLDKKIIIRDTRTGQVTVLSSDTIVNVVKFTPDGKYLVSGDIGGQLLIWELKNKKSTDIANFLNSQNTHLISIEDITFTADGNYIVFSSANGYIYKVFLKDYKIIAFFSEEISSELDTAWAFRPKGEFERRKQYERREQKRTYYLDSLITEYAIKYENFMKDESNKALELKNKSKHTVYLSIEDISLYYPEIGDEYFVVELKPKNTKGRKYEPANGRINIPLDEAKSFKENDNYKKATIKGIAYRDADEDIYKYISITVLHPVLKDKSYDFVFTGEKIK